MLTAITASCRLGRSSSLPLLILLTLIATLSLGVMLVGAHGLLSRLQAHRPVPDQIFMYVTPVIYPAKMFSPGTAVDSGSEPDVWNRHCLSLGDPRRAVGLPDAWPSLRHPPWASFLFAIFYFRRTERRFADFA